MGGAEQILLLLLRQLRRLRPEWKLTVLMGDSGPLLESVRNLGCDAEVLALPPEIGGLGDWGGANFTGMIKALPSVWRYRAALRAKLHRLAPDIVQTNGFKMHLLGALACPVTARLIWHVHDFVSRRRAMKTLLRWCAAKPAEVVAISPAVAQDFACVRPVRTIVNAVDLSRFLPLPHERHAEIRIGLIATFARWKGHAVFLHALALLPKDLAWHALIVGGELYKRAASQWSEAELRALTNQLGLGSRVEFTGFLPDTAPETQALDIVVHASTEPEPFGLVIAEAMAAGRAVVTTSASFVTDGVDGVVCRRNDPADLARAILSLAQDPALRARLGQAAAVTATRNFQPERMAREFITLYEAIT